jgi:integrase
LRFRPRFRGAADHDYVWAAKFGDHLHGGTILQAITARTTQAFGFSVSPHRFRHAAATFLSERDPVNVRVAKDLLGHTSFTMTEKHYIMSQSRIAGRKYAAILAKRRESRRPEHVRKRDRHRRGRVPAAAALPARHRAIAAPAHVASASRAN